MRFDTGETTFAKRRHHPGMVVSIEMGLISST